jgi:OPA family glycerol-3-phosphate transporter-like MFS transporter
MDFILVLVSLAFVIWLYFKTNPMKHGPKFMLRRFVNWFPLGMSYAFLYMARYNLNVSKNALGTLMTKEDFGIIFGVGTLVYGLSFLINGPLVDKWGGKKGMLIALLGACVANIMMGVVTYMMLKNQLHINLVVALSVLYAVNMFFQSYGAVSIIKIKAYWFHVRERGIFGAIFGTLISFGVYFAFDWGQVIADAAVVKPKGPMNGVQNLIRHVFAVDTGTSDAIWLVFFIPAFILIIWALLDVWLLKDTPGDAGFEDFDTQDASSGHMHKEYGKMEILKMIFSNPIMYTIGMIEFTSGVIRNGILQWYFIFAKEVPQIGAEFFQVHWGVLLCYTGIIGGFAAGALSDHLFHSRRGPPAAIFNGIMFFFMLLMCVVLLTQPVTVGVCAIVILTLVIGVHAIMSGTAAADFGGRKITATASGLVDGCVYLGSGFQSICLGYLTTKGWQFWPVFLLPFTVIGLFLCVKMWKALPAATKRYFDSVEQSKA